GRAHVQHQGFAAAPHRGSLQHQLARLRNGHEEPGDVGMSDRYRTTFLDLPREGFQYRAAGSEYIAEANAEKSSVHATRDMCRKAFGDPLAISQHTRRIRRFIRGD